MKIGRGGKDCPAGVGKTVGGGSVSGEGRRLGAFDRGQEMHWAMVGRMLVR